MIAPVPSESLTTQLHSSANLDDVAIEGRWEAWKEKGRTRDAIVRHRLGLVFAFAAIVLAFLVEFL